MSYDLLVFAPDRAPTSANEFLQWWEEQSEWSEDHEYADPGVSTPHLRAWFMEMIRVFPAMNGPFSIEELPEDEASVSDYCVGTSVIYTGFAWSKAEAAYQSVFDLAAKHQLGFFDASGDGDVWLPDGAGGLRRAFTVSS
jgi:hypothetical protein